MEEQLQAEVAAAEGGTLSDNSLSELMLPDIELGEPKSEPILLPITPKAKGKGNVSWTYYIESSLYLLLPVA